MKKAKTQVALLVRMPPDLHRQLEQIALQEDRSMAAVAREAIRARIERTRK